MTLTKRDLILRITERTNMDREDVQDVVQKTFDCMVEALAKGEKVELRKFGVFEVKLRKARVGRIPNVPGATVPIPERAIVKFKAGKDMRAEVTKFAAKGVHQAAPPKA